MNVKANAVLLNKYIEAAAKFKNDGFLNEAEAAYLQALKLLPSSLVARYNLANLQKAQGRMNEAKANYEIALKVDPNAFQVHFNLANLLRSLGDLDSAAKHYLQTIRVQPNFADAHSCLGATYGEMKRFQDAEIHHKKALKLSPNSPKVLANVADIFIQLGQYDEAKEVLSKALEIDANMPQSLYGMVKVALAIGTNEIAIKALHRCLELDWETASVTNTLAFVIASEGKVSFKEYLEEVKRFELRALTHDQRYQAVNHKFIRTPRTNRCLRVGYLSGDYLKHAVSYFSEPLFANHDKRRLELIAYSTNPNEDQVTNRFKDHVSKWVSLSGLSDEQACARIREDEVDVLIDLMGHTMWNRLGVLALRAAPVQAHYLGYFASTGISQMDYWIADETLAPQECNPQFSEVLWRLPRPWMAYSGSMDSPEVNWAPANDETTIWLGSFNNLSKITKETIELWAQILINLPNAKLLLKTSALKYSDSQQRIRQAFSTFGIGPERIVLKGDTENWIEHMNLYNQLDIALDPIGGWCGATTSCDALWMGVPVITLAGSWLGQRMTASLVTGLGHPEWIANDIEDYISKVTNLAHDVGQRVTLRKTQRERMRKSAICDAKGLAQALEEAYENMFDIWWAKQLSDLN